MGERERKREKGRESEEKREGTRMFALVTLALGHSRVMHLQFVFFG